MAHAPQPAATGVVGGKQSIDIGDLLTVLMMFFMVFIPFSNRSGAFGNAILEFVHEWHYPIFGAYILAQILESTFRDITDGKGQFIDNALAIIALLIGFGFVLAEFLRPDFGLTSLQRHLLYESIMWDVIDLTLGFIIPQRIASAIHERPGHP